MKSRSDHPPGECPVCCWTCVCALQREREDRARRVSPDALWDSGERVWGGWETCSETGDTVRSDQFGSVPDPPRGPGE